MGKEGGRGGVLPAIINSCCRTIAVESSRRRKFAARARVFPRTHPSSFPLFSSPPNKTAEKLDQNPTDLANLQAAR